MNLHALFRAVVLVALSSTLGQAAEFFVDAKAPAGGTGTTAAPFQTISDAVKAAIDGGTITVKGGVYRETVNITNKKYTTPLIIQATPGERVEVTAFDPLTGWKDEGSGLYTLSVPQMVSDFYVAGGAMRIARWPDKMQPYLEIKAFDPATGVVTLDQFPDIPAAEAKSLCFFTLSTNGNLDTLLHVKSIDAANKSVTVPVPKYGAPKVGDPAILFNAASFIKFPGEWACQEMDDKSWKITFRPSKPDDLKQTQTRSRKRDTAFLFTGSSNITLSGLEITGASDRGVDAENCDNLQIKHCLVYDNGRGINTYNTSNVLIDSCVDFNNHHGILLTEGKNLTVQGTEVAFNQEDGLDICGLSLQDPKAAPIENVLLKNDYIHGHIYLGHPDNTQTWGNVHGITYDGDLIMLGGNSSGQLEDLDNLKVLNSDMVGSDNYHFNLGTARGPHTATHDVEFRNDVLAFAGSLAINAPKDLTNMAVFNNVFLQNHPYYNGTNLTSGGNIHWGYGDPKYDLILWGTPDGKWTGMKTVADLVKAQPDLEKGSQQVDPQFKNVPVCLIRAHGCKTAANSLILMKGDFGKTYAVGDNIEVDGDGVPRKIDSVNDLTITFSPPLPAAPFRDVIMWNWGPKTDTQIDLTSPVAGGKDQPGNSLNVAAYQRGELDGSGKRSIPVLSPEAKAAWPNPSDFIFPYYLYLKGRFD